MKRKIAMLLGICLLAGTMNPTVWSGSAYATGEIEKQEIKNSAYVGLQYEESETTPSSVTDPDAYDNTSVIVVYKKVKQATEENTLKIADLSKKQAQAATASSVLSNMVVLTLDSEEALETAITNLDDNAQVAYVQPNYIYHTTASVDEVITDLSSNTNYNKQWAYDNDGSISYRELNASNRYQTVSAQAGTDIGLPEALANITATGNRETIVAIVDTGIMVDHTDLADAIWVNTGEIADNGIDDDGDGYIDDVHGWNFYAATSSSSRRRSSTSSKGNNSYYNNSSSTEDSHGTHCAGTIAASNNDLGIVGIAANANVKLMSVKCLGGADGEGTTESVVKGIQYAIDHGANIINLSLGGEDDDYALRNIIQNNPDVLFTIAAGNGNSQGIAVNNDETPIYPACYTFDNVLSVANLQCDGNLHYSANYGATTVQLAAPGTYIYSTSTGNGTFANTATSSYEYMSGSSMAAPMVAGAVALLYSKYDNYSMSQIRTALLSSVEQKSNLQGYVSSGGMLQLANTVALLEETSPALLSTPAIEETSTPVSSETASPTSSSEAEVSNAPLPTQKPDFNTSTEPGTTDSLPNYNNTQTATPNVQTTDSNLVSPTPNTQNSNYNQTSPTPSTQNNNYNQTSPTPNTQNSNYNQTSPTPNTQNYNGASPTPKAQNNYYNPATATPVVQTAQPNGSASNTASSISTIAPTATVKATIMPTVSPTSRPTTNNSTFSITSITTNKTWKRGAKVTFRVHTKNTSGTLRYTYILYRNGKKIKQTSKSTATFTYRFTKKGSYRLLVKVKNQAGVTKQKTKKKKLT